MKQNKYVIVKGSGGGGLGDRLWSVLVASLYCHLTKRLLYVDWSDGLLAPNGVNAFYTLFDVDNKLHGSKKLPIIQNQTDVLPVSWCRRTKKSLNELYKEDGHKQWDRMKMVKQYSFDLSNLNYQQPFLFMWDFNQYDLIRTYLPSSLDVDNRESVFRWSYRRNFSILSELEDSVRELIPYPDSTIAVHFRLTDESIKQKGKVYLRQYFHEIDKIRGTHDIKNIFLATDNISLIKLFRKKYSNVIVREKWMGQKGESIHLNDDCPDRLQSTKDAVIDLSLLSCCGHLITQNNSAFSSMARIISSAESKNIISLQSNYTLASGFKNILKTMLK